MNQITTIDNTRANLELAKAFSEAKMVPEHFKKSVGDCYIAIRLADSLGLEPWLLMQEMSIIQGKAFLSGKLILALINRNLAEPLRPEYSGAEGTDERTVTMTGRPEGEDMPLSITVKVKDAKTGNENWKKHPDQMLVYFGARMWGRRYTPNLMLGLHDKDEEIPGVNAPVVRTPIASPSILPKGVTTGDIIDQLTGEVLESPAKLELTPSEKWHDWGKRFVTAIRTSPDIDTADQWLAANAEILTEVEKENAKVHGNILAAVKDFKFNILNQGEGT